MSDELVSRIQALEDRAEIEELVIRYAEAVDNRDNDTLAACFTDDAEASFAGVAVPGKGGAAIVAFLNSLGGGGTTTQSPPKTSHLFMNIVIALDGDEADVRSSASVYSVRGEPEQLRIRGINYRDRMARTSNGWRIRRRAHTVNFEGSADSVPITPIAPPAK